MGVCVSPWEWFWLGLHGYCFPEDTENCREAASALQQGIRGNPSDLHIVWCSAAVVFQPAAVAGAERVLLTDKRWRIAWTGYSFNYCNEARFVSGPPRSYLQRNGSGEGLNLRSHLAILLKKVMEMFLYSVVHSSSALNHYLSFQRKKLCRCLHK